MKHSVLSSLIIGTILVLLNLTCWLFYASSQKNPAPVPTESIPVPPSAVLPTVSAQESVAATNPPVALSTQVPAPTLLPAMVLEQATQCNFSPSRIVSLSIQFSHPVEVASISPDRLTLFDGTRTIPWKLADSSLPHHPRQILITTLEPVSNAVLTIQTTAGIESRLKNVQASDRVQSLEIPISNAFGISGVTTECSAFGAPVVYINFTKPVQLARLQEFISCEPSLELGFAYAEYAYPIGSRIKILGDFNLGTTYQIHFREGLLSTEGYTLDTAASRSFAFKNREANVQIAVSGRYLQARQSLPLPIQWVNAAKLSLSAAQVIPENITQLLARHAGRYANYGNFRSWWNRDSDVLELTEPPVSLAVALPKAQKMNQICSESLDLNTVLPSSRKGVYFVEVELEDAFSDHKKWDSCILCISDLALSARVTEFESHIWVTSLESGHPVANASVELRSASNQRLGSGFTDAQGLARIRHVFNQSSTDEKTTDSKIKPFVAIARTADATDFTFIPLTQETIRTENIPFTRPYLDAGECQAFIFSDRGIYRPGDAIHVSAILRNNQTEALTDFPLTFEVRKPDGGLYESFVCHADAQGTVRPPHPIIIPESQPMGTWSLIVRPLDPESPIYGSRTIQVESFVPPQIQVQLTHLPTVLAPTSNLCFDVHADYLFGKPAGGLKARGTVAYREVAFQSPRWKDYQFENPTRKFASEFQSLTASQLNDQGTASLVFSPPKEQAPFGPIEATLEGTVQEPSGRSLSAHAALSFHYQPFYIGFKKPASSTFFTGHTNTLAIALVSPTEERFAQATNLKVEIRTLSHLYGLVHDAQRGYVWKDEVVTSPYAAYELRSAVSNDTVFAFSIPHSGEYRLILSNESGSTASAFDFCVTDAGTAPIRSNLASPTQLTLSWDQETYTESDTARLQISAPFTGLAWMTWHQDQILHSSCFEFTNTTQSIEIPIVSNFYPSVQIAVSLIQAGDAHSSWMARRASGITTLSIQRPEDALQVACTSRVQIVKGGSEVTAKILISPPTPSSSETTDASTQEACAVTLMVTDEAILQLTQERCPDPTGFFATARRSNAELFDIFHQLMPILDQAALFAQDAKIGGDALIMKAKSDHNPLMGRINPITARRFKPLSLVTNLLVKTCTPIEHTFTLPEFAGRVRVSAVAWTSTATGASASHQRITPKVVLKSDAPRFLAVGDTSQLTLSLHNTTDATDSVNFEIKTSAPLNVTSICQSVSLRARESQTLTFPLQTQQTTGVAKISLNATGFGESHSESLEIPVRPAMPRTTSLQCIALAPGQSCTLSPITHFLPESLVQSIQAQSNGLSQLLPALEYLDAYPYGCLEQTTSSAFPLVYAGKVLLKHAQENANNSVRGHELESKVHAAIVRICSLRNAYGYSQWHDVFASREADTIYACHFLGEAARAGYRVPDSVLTANTVLLRKLAQRLLAQQNLTLSAYACHVLALSSQADLPTALTLFDRRETLSPTAKAHLARAFAHAADPQRAIQLLESIHPESKPTSIEEATFLMLAWLDVDSPHQQTQLAQLLHAILQKRDATGHWLTTHQNALACLALGAYAAVYGEHSSELNLSLTAIDQTPLFDITNHTTRFTLPKSTPVVVQNKGTSTAYVLHHQAGIPALTNLQTQSQGIQITRKFFAPNGNEVNPEDLTPGDPIIVQLIIQVPKESLPLEDLVIEELLPACFEPTLGTLTLPSQGNWGKNPNRFLLRQEARDDRMILFLRPLYTDDIYTFYYAATIVSAGSFTLPPTAIEDMYRPEISARTAPSTLTIRP